MRTTQEIKEEIARLEAEADSVYEREIADQRTRDEAEKRAKVARQKGAELEARRNLEERERQLAEDVRRDEEWWRERRENCYVPARGALGELGLCQPFLNALSNDEAQGCDWCWQCVRGYANPNYSIALRYERRG